ncbi:AMP-binding protein [Prescottella defluvii]|uniref:(2,3-dihydroxybenzoyl)adenylate synthase n=1 Tax=Prescottella defluvii TaxID=1323361 RepID=UPI0004F3E8F2|nr:AMP-binding protein [Prescottella defluvii]
MTTALRRTPLAGVEPYPPEFAQRYRNAGYWTDETFAGFLPARAAQYPDHTAVTGTGEGGVRRTLTYRELNDNAGVLAAGLLRLGIRPGDRVVLQIPNMPEYVELLFAVFTIGALPVFALPAHRRAEVGYFCEFTDAAAYVIADRHAGFDYRTLAREIVAGSERPPVVVVVGDAGDGTGFVPLAELRTETERPRPFSPAPDSIAFLQLSGGTTGVPKLIPRTHADYLYSVRASAEICALSPDTRMLVSLPAAHNFPMSSPGILGVLHSGGRVVLAPDPTPSTSFELIERERITIASLVPPLALTWMSSPAREKFDLSSLEVLQVGGAKFSAEAARRVRGELGCALQQVFGMAEGLVNYTRVDDPDDVVVTTQGQPISPDDEVRVVDDEDRPVPVGAVGNLLTRGPYTIRGYYAAPEHNRASFTPDGFYRTGDRVRLTETGHLVVEGRAKDQINRGGEKVAAEEIENHLLAHPAVRDVAVVPKPDAYLGERTFAFVVGEDGEDTATPPRAVELRAFLRERGLAAYKIPDGFAFVTDFPVTGVGKVSRTELRRALESTFTTKPANDS